MGFWCYVNVIGSKTWFLGTPVVFRIHVNMIGSKAGAVNSSDLVRFQCYANMIGIKAGEL